MKSLEEEYKLYFRKSMFYTSIVSRSVPFYINILKCKNNKNKSKKSSRRHVKWKFCLNKGSSDKLSPPPAPFPHKHNQIIRLYKNFKTVNPISAVRGRKFEPLPLFFFYITQKVFVWGCWNFLTFRKYLKPSL